MTPVTLVMAYYENAGMLKEQFRRLRELPLSLRDHMHVVIVDDGSPKAPAVAEDIGMPLQIYRMDVDVRWNQDACRNIGVKHAETDWVLMTDMDHVVSAETWDKIVNRRHDRNKVYKFSRVSAPDLTPYKPHPNTWLVNRATFERAGGYDERYAGYYGTDADIRDRLRETVGEENVILLKETVIRFPREVIPDASTTTYLRKQPEDREMLPKLKRKPGDQTIRFQFPYHRVA